MNRNRDQRSGEIYIFPDLTTAPSSLTEEYGVEPGPFEASETNFTDADVIASGQVREGTDSQSGDESEFPVVVTAVGRAKIPSLGSTSVGPLAGRTSAAGGLSMPVSRFSVQRNGRKFGVTTTARPRPTDTEIALPAGYSVAGRRGGILLEDSMGRLLYVELLEEDASPGDYKIRVLRYSQKDDGPQGDWSEVVGVSGPLTLAGYTFPAIAGVLFQGDVYFVVTNRDPGTFHVFRLDGNTITDLEISVTPSPGMVINGGASLVDCGSHVLLALGIRGQASGLGSAEPREIHIMRSPDMRTWYAGNPDDTTSTNIVGYSLVSTTDEEMRAISMHSDGLRGFAVGTGRIYFTEDGGKTWATQKCPVPGVRLEDVEIIGENENGELTAIACGQLSVILRTGDSGKDWKIITASSVVRNAAGTDLSAVFDTEIIEKWSLTIGDAVLLSICSNGSDVWVGGTLKLICLGGFGTNLADAKSLTEIKMRDIGFSLWVVRDMVLVPAQTDQVLLFGAFVTTSAANLTHRVVRLSNAANNETPTATAESTMNSTDPHTGRAQFWAAVRREQNIDGAVWAVGERGLMAYRKTNGTWVVIQPIFTGTRFNSIAAIFHPTDSGQDEFLIGTQSGRTIHSCDGATCWVGQRANSGFPVHDVAIPESGVALAVANGVYRSEGRVGFRVLPELVKLPNGEILLAACNTIAGEVDLFFSSDSGESFQPREVENASLLSFTPEPSPSSLTTNTPRISAFFTDSGELFLIAGVRGIVSLDGNGSTWTYALGASLPVNPKLDNAIATDAEQSFKVMRAYGGMRIFGVVRAGSTLKTFTDREWLEGHPVYPPVIPGKRMWLGVGNMYAEFGAASLTEGDFWTSELAHRFPASNLVVETRSSFWLSKNRIGLKHPELIFDWDRKNADIVAQKGFGDSWNISGFFMVGTGFRQAVLQLSDPEYTGNTFPTDPAEYLEFNLTSEVERGVADAETGVGTAGNVVRIAGANWIPGQFRPGYRQYYLANLDDSGTIFRIVNNTYDTLVIERNTSESPIEQGQEVVIFTDRFVCDGSGGRVGSSPHPPLVSSPWQHPRHVRLKIPPTQGFGPGQKGHVRIDTIIAGPIVPVAATRPGNNDPTNMDEEWRWIPTPLTDESVGRSGVIAIAYTSPRPVQRWSFRYSAQEWYERDARLAHFSSRMRDAFCLVFDAAHPVETAELVRRTFRSEGVEHLGGDLFTDVVEVEEVV